MRGWVAVWNGSVPAGGFFDATNGGSSINELELLASLHGLRFFVRFARHQSVWPVTDSKITDHIFLNLTSHSPRLIRHLISLSAL